jgi:hypothetical protein
MSNTDTTGVIWRKSSYSNGEGACIEAGAMPGVVLVRDTTLHGRGLALRLAPAGWAKFTAAMKRLARVHDHN